jgi:hypothetical protein
VAEPDVGFHGDDPAWARRHTPVAATAQIGLVGRQTSTVYDGQGNVIGRTTVTTQSGCSSGCGWVVTIVAVVFVLAVPAESFPLPMAVLAYVVEGVLLIAAVAAAARRARGGHRA